MGFFQSLKDDLSTAMNELIGEENEGMDSFEESSDIEEFADEKEEYTEEYVEEYEEASVDEAAFEGLSSEEPFDQGILDLVNSSDAPVVEHRSARNAINSLKEAGKRLEKKKLQEAIDNGAVGMIEDEELPIDSSEDIADNGEGVNDALDFDVAKMLDSLDLDSIAAENSSAPNMEEAVQLDINSLLSSLEEEEALEEIKDSIEGAVNEEPEESIVDEPVVDVVEAMDSLVEEPVVEHIDQEVVATEVMPESVEDIIHEESVVEDTIVEEVITDSKDDETIAVDITSEVNAEVEPETTVDIKVPDNTVEESNAEPKLMPKVPGYVPKLVSEYSDETAVITKGMRVVGNVQSNGNMDVIGTIVGDISIVGKLSVSGTIVGKSSAHEIFADGAEINGDIDVTGTVKIGSSSVIIGNISSTSAVIAGAVKGDIDVQGPVVLDSSAIVMGNIKSMSVQINNGAVVEGLCSQCYAQVSPTTFFNDFKKTTSLLNRK